MPQSVSVWRTLGDTPRSTCKSNGSNLIWSRCPAFCGTPIESKRDFVESRFNNIIKHVYTIVLMEIWRNSCSKWRAANCTIAPRGYGWPRKWTITKYQGGQPTLSWRFLLDSSGLVMPQTMTITNGSPVNHDWLLPMSKRQSVLSTCLRYICRSSQSANLAASKTLLDLNALF